MALVLCFVPDPEQALRECQRVLVARGRLFLGVIPADSPWGRAYEQQGAGGHPLYAHARFHTASETVTLVESAGFQLQGAASTLFWEPGTSPQTEPLVRIGIVADAGLLGLLFMKTGLRPTRGHDVRGRE